MNKDETLALFAKGKDAWNEWARERLAEKKALQEAGEWVEDEHPSAWNEKTRNWHERAGVDFSEHTFEDDPYFNDLTFPGSAWFDRAKFEGGAEFGSAKFEGNADFGSAIFKGYARFGSATFKVTMSWFSQTEPVEQGELVG